MERVFIYIYIYIEYLGENIKIGIIDSGIAENIAKLLPIEDIINLSSDNSTNDDYCHGTGIASVMNINMTPR